jgi:hypothetical protein
VSPKTTVIKSTLHTYWTPFCKILSAEQKSSMQVLESSIDEDHAVGDVERRGIDASEEAIGNDSNVMRVNAPRASHGVAHVAIHTQVASQETVVINVQNADMALY